MKQLLYISLAVLMLTACTNEDSLKMASSNNKEIGFNVSVQSSTRAASGYCNNNFPMTLWVWACVPDGSGYKPYFNSEMYTFSNDETTYCDYKANNKRYWPDSQIRFFAYPFNANALMANTRWSSDGSVLKTDFQNPTDPTKQFDFIYASSGDLNGGLEDDGRYYAQLDFHHALSQLEFKAMTNDDTYYVEIVSVKVTNVMFDGHYTFPVKTKSGYLGHSSFSGNDYVSTSRGTWSNLSGKSDCEATFDPVCFTESDGKVSLTEEDTETYADGHDGGIASDDTPKEYNINTMYLIPQDARSTGKIVVKMRVWKMSDPSKGHQASDKLLLGTESAYAEKEFIIPNVWLEGKHYIYTLNIIGDEMSFSLNVDDYDLNSNEVVTY